jgi:hypothetical protein
VILVVGIAAAALQLAIVLYAVSRDGGTVLDALWLSVPAVLTIGWTYARRRDRFLPVNVLCAIGVATALQAVVYLGLRIGDAPAALLPAVLLVAMVFLMAAWSGRGF